MSALLNLLQRWEEAETARCVTSEPFAGKPTLYPFAFALRDGEWARVYPETFDTLQGRDGDWSRVTLDALQGAVQEAIEARGSGMGSRMDEVHRNLLRGLHHRPNIGTAVQRQLAVVPRRSAARGVPGCAQGERALVSARRNMIENEYPEDHMLHENNSVLALLERLELAGERFPYRTVTNEEKILADVIRECKDRGWGLQVWMSAGDDCFCSASISIPPTDTNRKLASAIRLGTSPAHALLRCFAAACDVE